MKSINEAIALRDSGRVEDAIQLFHSMAEESTDTDEKSVLLGHEGRCHAAIGRFREAELVMARIHELAPRDKAVRLSVDFLEACMMSQLGEYERAIRIFDWLSAEYSDLLRSLDFRDMHEQVRLRQAFCLVDLGRYDDALSDLRDASTSGTLSVEDQQLALVYLGVCYQGLRDHRSAKEALLRAIELPPRNQVQAEARYRVAIL